MAKNNTCKADANDAIVRAAKDYVDQQLATMKKYGTTTKQLTTEEYNKLVSEVVEATTK